MSTTRWNRAAVFSWHREMYVALLHHLFRSCRAWHFDRMLRVILVKGESSDYEVWVCLCVHAYVHGCICIQVHVWFVPTLSSEQMCMPACASPLLTPGHFNCVGSAPFIPCLSAPLKREKAQRQKPRQVRGQGSVGRHRDSSVWLTLLVTLS